MDPFKPTAVVLFSGGLDSGVLAHDLLLKGETVLGVNARYGSKHNPHEDRAAEKLQAKFGGRHAGLFPGKFDVTRMNLEPAFIYASGPMFAGALPEGHYEEETMRQTVVPGRNLVLIAVAASIAESVGAGTVYIGAHAGDHYIYPDCRLAFLSLAQRTVEAGTENRVTVAAPFSTMDKQQIVALGIKNGFPFELSRTCYSANPTACGKCGSCQERLAAFAACGATDPLPYESRTLIPAAAEHQ